jgi:hypothetical protein
MLRHRQTGLALLRVPLAKRRPFGACLVGVALLTAGCSSGEKQSAPTTKATTTTARAKATNSGGPEGGTSNAGSTGPIGQVGAPINVCPQDKTVIELNRNIKGLDKMFVPISATAVRICEYVRPNPNRPQEGPVVSGIGVLRPPVVEAFEAETNRLPRFDEPDECPALAPLFIVTFVSDTQRVHVYETTGCGYGFLSNGVIHLVGTPHWNDELRQYIRPYSLGATNLALSGPTGPESEGPTGVGR